MRIGFIGMGNMGQMLVAALVRSGALQPSDVVISNRSRETLKAVAERLPGVSTAFTNREIAQDCSVIFLCIKPAETKAVIDDIGPYLTAGHLLITITNTVDISVLEQITKARVAKVIPSLVHAIGEGASLLIYGGRCTGADTALLERLFTKISKPITIAEGQARVASDLTSCGPAFMSYVWRAFAVAARKYQPDLADETVVRMIRVTAEATCLYMEQTGFNFDDIIRKVSTPGGITAEGIAVLDEQMTGVWEQLIETTIVKEDAKRAKLIL